MDADEPDSEQPKKKRPPGNPNWSKGMASPNPAGRPRLSPEARVWMNTWGGRMDVASLEALKRAIVQAKNLGVSVKAAEIWLSRRLPPLALSQEIDTVLDAVGVALGDHPELHRRVLAEVAGVVEADEAPAADDDGEDGQEH